MAQSIATLVKGLIQDASAASALGEKVKGHSVRFAARALELASIGSAEALAEGEKAAVQIEALPGSGKGYAANLRRVFRNPEGAAKVFKECKDPAVGFKALTNIFKKHADVFPAEAKKGGRPAEAKPMVKSEHRLDQKDGAVLALQSIKAAATKLGIPMGATFDRFDNALCEALAVLSTVKSEAK